VLASKTVTSRCKLRNTLFFQSRDDFVDERSDHLLVVFAYPFYEVEIMLRKHGARSVRADVGKFKGVHWDRQEYLQELDLR